MDTLTMAWRNVWRNKRRTIATMAATTLALFVMINYYGLIAGYLTGMEKKLLDVELGDMQVHAPGYLDSPSLHTRIEDPDALQAKLDAKGFTSSARLLGGGLAAAGDTSAGAALRGVDVDRDATVSKIGVSIARGRWLDPQDAKGVVIGWRLARTLNVELGAELLILSQAADGSIANDLYTIRGVLKAVSDGVDRSSVFMNTAAFRELMVVPEGAHQILVRRPNNVDLETAATTARSLAPDLHVQTWRQLVPTLASYLDTAKSTIMIFFVIIYLAIGIVIMNAMLMAVFERIKEFGVLKALGMGPVRVFALILIESGILTGLATIIGVALATPTVWYLKSTGIDLGSLAGMSVMGIAWDPRWYAEVSVDTFVTPVMTLVAIVAGAVLYPALKAAMIRPVDALTHK